MAAEVPTAQVITVTEDQCGYCLEDGARRADPRCLPCGHSFCLPCLQNDYLRIKAIRCPICREFVTVETELDKLPSAEFEGPPHSDVFCVTCLATSNQKDADEYCKKCDEAFCGKHLKLHKELYPCHVTMTQAEWKDLQPVRDSMFCEQHKQYPVTNGCKLCHGLFCNVCCYNEQHQHCPSGTGGDPHEFDVLQNLAIKAKQELRETLATIQLKKDEMDSLEKELTAMMGVIEQKREQTIAELDDAREKQVARLSEAIITINQSYEDMKERFEKRMLDIQTQAEEYAAQITRLQTRLDRGIEEGKMIHHCKSDAEVMRRIAGLMEAAGALCEIAAPVYFDVNSALRTGHKVNSQPDSCMTELIESPLTYYFKEAGVELRQVAVRTGPPRALVFSHTHSASKTRLSTTSSSILSYSPDAQRVAYYSKVSAGYNQYDMNIEVLSTKFAQNTFRDGYYNVKADIVHMNMSNRMLVSQYKNDPIITISAFVDFELSEWAELAELSFSTTLETYSLPEDFVPIDSFALITEDAVLCCNSAQPELYIWSCETDSRRQVDIKFDEPTKVTHVTAGPGRSVLCFCEQAVEDNRSWYEPNPPSEKKPANSLALVDVDSGTILWQQSRSEDDDDEDDPLTHVIDYSDGYFFMRVPSSRNVDIIDATNGHTCIKQMELTGYNGDIKDFAVVQISEGDKKLMVRDHDNNINVIDFVY